MTSKIAFRESQVLHVHYTLSLAHTLIPSCCVLGTPYRAVLDGGVYDIIHYVLVVKLDGGYVLR